ncbi:hypothetical protein QBC41DRAFT_219843 [Cercophora samala]|uniref:Uncharacterized protein n=1 Tax=Cercophora samala TaxID=330535 RepID=A0AA39ZHL7_9PEZI|nr:hypothetical protein QBC41DRAFT_219843 [Cercophora samala]
MASTLRYAGPYAIEQLADSEREAWAADGPVEELPPVMVPVMETRTRRRVADERHGPNRPHHQPRSTNIDTPGEREEQPMADDPLPTYTPYAQNVPNDTAADHMDEDSDNGSPEPEYPTILSPPPPYHAAAQRDPPTYSVAIPSVQSIRRQELQQQWVSYAEGKRFEHRRNYVSWKRARSTTGSNSASDISSATLDGTPSTSPSSPVALATVPTAPIVAPPAPPTPAATPLTTRQRAKRALTQFPAKLGCSLAKVIMLDKMASWAAKTRHWKKTKRDYVKEVSGERSLFVGAVKRVPDGQPGPASASASVSPRSSTPVVQIVPLRADSVMSVVVPNEGSGSEGARRHESGSDSPGSRPGTATGLVRTSSLLKRVGSLTKGKKSTDGEGDFPIPELGRRPSRRRPLDNLELVGAHGNVVA